VSLYIENKNRVSHSTNSSSSAEIVRLDTMIGVCTSTPPLMCVSL